MKIRCLPGRMMAQPIPPEHGGPVRLIIPQLYAWKSAKWVKGVRFLEHDQAGFWEEGGYHMRGVPWGQATARDFVGINRSRDSE